MRFFQTSLDQTGIAVLEDENGNTKNIPLFTLEPSKEASNVADFLNRKSFVKYDVKHVVVCNNLLDYRIEDEIEAYQKEHSGVIPQDLLEQLLSGFPHIYGMELEELPCRYA